MSIARSLDRGVYWVWYEGVWRMGEWDGEDWNVNGSVFSHDLPVGGKWSVPPRPSPISAETAGTGDASGGIAGTGERRRLIPKGATWSECPELKLENGQMFTILAYAGSPAHAQVAVAALLASLPIDIPAEGIMVSKIQVGQAVVSTWTVGSAGALERLDYTREGENPCPC